jgi:hypothetical protein
MGKGGKSESGFRGVYCANGRWVVQIRSCGINENLGSFATKQAAVRTAKARWRELFGGEMPSAEECAPMTAQERLEIESMEYPINPIKLINAAMRDA